MKTLIRWVVYLWVAGVAMGLLFHLFSHDDAPKQQTHRPVRPTEPVNTSQQRSDSAKKQCEAAAENYMAHGDHIFYGDHDYEGKPVGSYAYYVDVRSSMQTYIDSERIDIAVHVNARQDYDLRTYYWVNCTVGDDNGKNTNPRVKVTNVVCDSGPCYPVK